jgi:glycosyltransferase involved in cell wall biosynthesis
LLKRSKYYFQLSEYEGFGIGALEALASGNIVFHSGVGGLKEGMGPHGMLVKDTSDFMQIGKQFFNVDENYEFWKNKIPDQILYVENNFSFDKRKDLFLKVFSRF